MSNLQPINAMEANRSASSSGFSPETHVKLIHLQNLEQVQHHETFSMFGSANKKNQPFQFMSQPISENTLFAAALDHILQNDHIKKL